MGELIHILWGYHKDRLRNGHPFALENEAANTTDYRLNPNILIQNIAEHGIQPLDLIGKVRKGTQKHVIQMLSDAITGSLWDSCNHILNIDRQTATPTHKEFLSDPSLSNLQRDMDTAGESLHSHRGTKFLHSGIRVGVGIVTNLTAIGYKLPKEHPFDVARISSLFAQTNSFELNMLHMDLLLRTLQPPEEWRQRYHDETAPLGMPTSTLRKHCDSQAIGCPARLAKGSMAKDILRRYNLDQQTDDEQQSKPAIILIATRVQRYVSEQIQQLFATLSPEEQDEHIAKTDLELLRGDSWPTMKP